MEKHLTLFSKINFTLLCLLSASFVLYKKIAPIILILLGITWIAEGKFRTKFSTLFHENKSFPIMFCLLILFYIFHIIALTYTNNINDGLFELEKKMSFLVFPLILYPIFSMRQEKKNLKTLLLVFIIACIASSLFCFISAFSNYLASGNTSDMLYGKFSILAHPTYFALFMITAILSLVAYLSKNWSQCKLSIKLLSILAIAWFILIIMLCNSRAAIISLGVVAIFMTAYLIIKSKKYILGILAIAITAGLIFLVHEMIPGIFDRFSSGISEVLHARKIDDIKNWDGTTMRVQIMYSSNEIINDNFLLGVAPGDVTDELVKNYEKNGFTEAAHRQYNAHNQFTQTMLGLGIIGLIMFICILLIPFIYAIKNKDLLLMSFIITVSILMLFESMLQRQDGIMFIVFCLVFMHGREKIFSYQKVLKK